MTFMKRYALGRAFFHSQTQYVYIYMTQSENGTNIYIYYIGSIYYTVYWGRTFQIPDSNILAILATCQTDDFTDDRFQMTLPT